MFRNKNVRTIVNSVESNCTLKIDIYQNQADQDDNASQACEKIGDM